MICFLISFNEMCFQASSIQFNYFFMLKKPPDCGSEFDYLIIFQYLFYSIFIVFIFTFNTSQKNKNCYCKRYCGNKKNYDY